MNELVVGKSMNDNVTDNRQHDQDHSAQKELPEIGKVKFLQINGGAFLDIEREENSGEDEKRYGIQ